MNHYAITGAAVAGNIVFTVASLVVFKFASQHIEPQTISRSYLIVQRRF